MNEIFQCSPNHPPPSELGNVVMEIRWPVNTRVTRDEDRGSVGGDAGVGDESINERGGTVWAESVEAGCSR